MIRALLTFNATLSADVATNTTGSMKTGANLYKEIAGAIIKEISELDLDKRKTIPEVIFTM